MKPVTASVSPAAPGYGYMNRILWIDLSAMEIRSQESTGYLPKFLGGRGLAAKIAWDEYPQPIDPFDPANPLMIFPGALTGTRSPYNGRTTVCSFSPQAYPHACQQDGLIDELNGITMDWNSPEFWDTFLHAIAYREGSGDALAEGAWRASHILGLGEELIQRFYPGWGQKAHWDGRTVDSLPFPFWIPAALQWLSDTRDPFNSGHGSLRGMYFNTEAAATEDENEREKIIAAARTWGKMVYGTEAAFDPYSGYEGKARVAHFHTIRPIIKDCVPLDDFTFPLLIDDSKSDYRVVLQDDDGREIAGIDVEHHLFCLGTGVEWSKEEFEQAAARVYSLERALQVRHWGRDRSFDEMVLPYFDQPESYQNPLLDQRHALDREQFRPVLDEFYSLHGWEPATGRPTKETLVTLGLEGVYEQMMSAPKVHD